MGCPRKKLKVHRISQIQTVSVTSYSSSTRGKQTVTRSTFHAPSSPQSTFHAPSSPRSIDTPAFSPTGDATDPPACNEGVKGPKKRYTSTVCALSDLLFFFFCCTLFIVQLLSADFVQHVTSHLHRTILSVLGVAIATPFLTNSTGAMAEGATSTSSFAKSVNLAHHF